jgi:hypothetical protein
MARLKQTGLFTIHELSMLRDLATKPQPRLETISCGEFERLKELVAKAGGYVSIESARPAGQFPLKVVADLLQAAKSGLSADSSISAQLALRISILKETSLILPPGRIRH